MSNRQTYLALVLAAIVAGGGCAQDQTKKLEPLRTTPTTPEPTAPNPVAPSPPRVSENPNPKPEPANPVLAASNEPTPKPPANPPVVHPEVVARIGDRPITMEQLIRPLIDGYGLNFLLNIAQLEYAKQQTKGKIEVSADDIEHERELTMAKMFADAEKPQYPQLLTQFLGQQHVSAAEFGLVLETNTYLRKIVEPQIKDKITDDMVQESFRTRYGETVSIRIIQMSNMIEIAEAKRRLAGGEPFSQVAQELSRNAATAQLGGEMPRFSRSAGYPQALKDAAFALTKGEVSDPVQFDGTYNLIKLEERFAPRAVKYEDVKEGLRADLVDLNVSNAMQELRKKFANDVIKVLTIADPVLKKQYEDKLHQRDEQIQERDDIKAKWERERDRILNSSSTQPSTAPTPSGPEGLIAPSDAPSAPAPGVARPPATQSGAGQ